jgi:very-short-patch-repair endonuclease
MTDAEISLWSKLRRKQLYRLQFYRQKPVGNYIVDFYCPAAKLVIEIDGGQHYTERGQAQDYERDAFLKELGLSVLRFSNLDALGNIDGVVAEILRHLEKVLGEGQTKSP